MTNDAAHDQTGTADKAEHYQAYDPDAEKFVVIDRSRAADNIPEPHMLETYGRTGGRRWGQADNLDWSDPEMIKDLNNWRDQLLRHGIFQHKRDNARPTIR